MIDLCTVVFEPELEVLHQQARSVDRYVDAVGTIYVVINDHTDPEQIHTGAWGRYCDHVVVLTRRTFGTDWSNNGWVSQQALKLATAAVSQADHCVVLDAKTILVKPLPNVVTDQGLAVGTLPIYPVFEASRQIVNSLWPIDLDRQLGPGGVPFWFEPRAVRAMIADCEQRTGQNFVSWFQAQGRLTEFLLYSGWLEYTRGLDLVTASSRITVANLCHSEVAMADRKLDLMQHSHTISIHRSAWPHLTQQQQQQYQQLLKERLS